MRNNTLYRLFLLTIIPVLMQSCFSAKEYVRPAIESDALYRTDNIKTDSLSIAELSWTQLFTDPILTDYIQRGLDNNLDIRVALENINAAQAYLRQGKAGYYPTLDAMASYGRSTFSENGAMGMNSGSASEQFELSGSLSWEADIWGKIRSTDRASQATYLQSVAAHQAVKTNLIAAISSTYYRLLALDKQKDIIKETIEARKSSLNTTQALKDAGQVTEVAVKQTEAQLYSTEIILVDIEKNIKLLENTFSILMGESVRGVLRGALEDQEVQTELTTGVPADLLVNRPDVLQAEYGLINAFELTNVARSHFYPSLRLTAAGGFQSLELDNLFSASSLFSNLAGSLAQPILNGRRIRTQHEVSQAQQEQALLRYKKTLLMAGKEVSDALYEYEAESKKIEVRKMELASNMLAETYSEELLNNGLANYLEVLTARQNVLNSQLNLIDSQFGQLNAIVTLYEALGGGWQ
ncbi:efflux transporter outer membrane subunit [Arenibacter certesii]|uniref:Multidrug transporter n=1 Tax=Arenibacter certesii TaxID=228955 RepID=A0A918IR41_9FLAO|nr:efflux transporter outer membrane subunit [Arenibacter certesii]GGW24934.1 multidrug transporter [Arenibacter certesii]